MALSAKWERRRARFVVGTAVTALLGSAALHLEEWPLTSYWLFSHVRTDERTTRELIAIHADGTTAVVRFGGDNPLLATTSHLLSRLDDEDPATQCRMAEAWLDLAGIEDDGVEAVRVDVVTQTISPEADRWVETSRTTETRVDL